MRKSSLVFAGLLLAGLTASAGAQIGVYIGTPPPPIRYEERGPIPYPGAYWVEGYWEPVGNHYRWVRGRWDRPPYPNAYYTHGHWDHYDRGWRYHPGRWDHDDEHDHHHDDDDHRGREHR
jgi:hypothetical protein